MMKVSLPITSRVFLVIAFLLFAYTVVFERPALRGTESSGTSSSDIVLASIVGGSGDWECGCEANEGTCSYYEVECNALRPSCTACSGNNVMEECVGWGICLPFVTCTDCAYDDSVPCGKQQWGQCIAIGGGKYTCEIVNTWNDNCDDATQCHDI